MNKGIYIFVALIFLGSAGTKELIWSEENPLIAQSGHMEHKMHGEGMKHSKPQTKPMGEMKHGMKMEMATEGIFEGVGEVKALVPEKSQIVVGHEKIKGFMEAMPMGMGYPVESKTLLKGLKPGDRVKFKIDAAKKKIVAIERLPMK